MESNEKVQYGIIMFLSTLVYPLIRLSYNSNLANSIRQSLPLLETLLYIFLGIVLLFLALDFILAGKIPEKLVEIPTWIYILIIGLLIIILSIMIQLKL